MSGLGLRASPQHRWIAEAAGGDPGTEAELLARWAAGEPLQYVLGRWSFAGVDLAVDGRALIPRPETEVLLEVALELFKAPARVVDLGTGSGAIALAVAAACHGVKVWAVDVSATALDLARHNAADNPDITFLEGHWYEPLPLELRGRVDLIVSNPPYVSQAEFAVLDPQVRDWEPRQALLSGPTGLECLERVIVGATDWLRPGGHLALECAPHQADEVADLCWAHGLVVVGVHPDLTGRPRVVSASRGGASAR